MMKKVNGSVSVVLALIITLMMSFCMVLIESARENTMLLKADVVFDAGTKSLLAEYHINLWEKYDLLYIDCSYGQDIPNYTNSTNHLMNYVHKNLVHNNGNWLNLEYLNASISDVCLATDINGLDFYSQAVSSVKDQIGILYIEKILNLLVQTEERHSWESSIYSDRQKVSERIEEENGTEVEVEPAIWGLDKDGNQILIKDAKYEEIDIENPLEEILSADLLLQQVIDNMSKVSKTEVDLQELASNRSLAAGNSQQNNDEYGLVEKVLFCNYLFQKFTTYRDSKASDAQEFKCELEYLIGGSNSDCKNMELVTAKLLLIREVDNYLGLLQNTEKQLEAHVIAASASSLAPWLEPIVYQAIILYWAYEESVSDLQVLYHGGNVPLVKSLSIGSDSIMSLNYEEYLMILCMMTSKEQLCMRAIDLIELDIRDIQDTFRMDGCISAAVFTGEFTDAYDKKYTVTKKVQYY